MVSKQNKKLKIIFSHYGTLDGGDACGFTRSFNLAKGLVKQKNQVLFLTTQKTGFKFPYLYENREGVDIYAFPEILPNSFRKGGLSFFSMILKILFVLFTKADIVHSDTGHRPSSGIPCIVHRFFYKSKYFSEWWEHFGKGGIYNEMPKWYRCSIGQLDLLLEEYNRKKADACLPISMTLYYRSLRIGIPKERLMVLNGGTDVDKIKFVEDNEFVKKELGINPDDFVIGLIGINDTEFINNIFLFKIIEKLVKNRKQLKVIATGKVSDYLIKDTGVDNASFLKIYNWLPYNEFVKIITTVDVFTLIQNDTLRNRSRFPNKLGDYMAAGRPIITNTIGEVEIYFKKYPNLFYVVNNDEKDMETQLLTAYEDWKNGKVDYKRIREIAIKNSWEMRSIQLNKFYLKICNKLPKN